MGLLKSVVKNIAVTTVVLVGRRIVLRIASKLADRVVKSPPPAK